jgi:hypothetical protein
VPQASPRQTYGAQATGCADGHTGSPVQAPPLVKVAFVQEAARQIVPGLKSVHLPSTEPPAATLQAWQSVGSLSPQSESQQTPSTQ